MNRELLLLGLLRQQQMHGYELHEFINTRLTTCTDLKKSAAYYLLKKMETDGWLEQETTRQGNRPPRQVYRLTPAGEAVFQRLLREHLGRHHRVHLTDDISLAFLDALPPDEALALLRKRRTSLQADLERAEQAPGHLQGGMSLLLEHWRHHLLSELHWLDSLIRRMESAAPDGGLPAPP